MTVFIYVQLFYLATFWCRGVNATFTMIYKSIRWTATVACKPSLTIQRHLRKWDETNDYCLLPKRISSEDANLQTVYDAQFNIAASMNVQERVSSALNMAMPTSKGLCKDAYSVEY